MCEDNLEETDSPYPEHVDFVMHLLAEHFEDMGLIPVKHKKTGEEGFAICLLEDIPDSDSSRYQSLVIIPDDWDSYQFDDGSDAQIETPTFWEKFKLRLGWG